MEFATGLLDFAITPPPGASCEGEQTWSEQELSAFTAAAQSMRGPTASPAMWAHAYPDFGCALVYQSASTDSSLLHVRMIGLDEWDFRIVRGTGESGYVHTSSASRLGKTLYVGAVPAQHAGVLHSTIASILVRVQNRHGNSRNASNEDGGMQHTPGYLHAIACAALGLVFTAVENAGLQDLPEVHVPDSIVIKAEGGWTDVGRHTGGEKRPTAWPLTLALLLDVLQQANPPIPSPELTVDLLVAEYRLQQCTARIAELASLSKKTAQTLPQTAVDEAMDMLTQACRLASALASTCLDPARVGRLTGRCEAARAELEAVSAAAAQAHADKFQLRLPETVDSTWPGPAVSGLPVTLQAVPGDLSQARALALQNLSWAAHLPADCTLEDANTWSQSSALASLGEDLRLHLILSNLPPVLFSCCIARLPLTAETDKAPVMTERELELIRYLVSVYRAAKLSYMASSEGKKGELLSLALHSTAVLLVWGCFCAHHQAAKTTEPMTSLTRFDVAPQYQDLKHLLVQDSAMEDALLHVSAYLARHQGVGKAVFSGRGSLSDTHDLADAVAAASPDIQGRWTVTQQQHKKRAEARYAVIVRKQTEAATLRKQIAAAEAELIAARAKDYESAYSYVSDWRTREKRAEEAKEAAVSAVQRRLNSLHSELSRALKAPDMLLQPLPSDGTLGPRALFYAHMPALMQHVAYWSFECYEVLCAGAEREGREYSYGVKDTIDVQQHYKSNQSCEWWRCPSPAEPTEAAPLKLCTFKPPASHCGRQTVDGITSSSDGVWYPGDGTTLHILSTRNSFPTMYSKKALAEAYTMALPAGNQKLQWSMLQYGADDPTRGNLGPANLDKRPQWLNKPAYLAFCALRAYPMQQLRKLCCALRDESLPLEHEGVHALVRQVIYHVGELTVFSDALKTVHTACAPSDVAMCWRRDLRHNGPMLEQLNVELLRLADKYAAAQRSHAAILLLGELAGHMAGVDGRYQDTVRAYARIGVTWAEQLQVQVEQAIESNDVASAAAIRWKQHVYLSYAVVAYGGMGGMALTAEVAALLLLCSVWMKATEPLLGESTEMAEKMRPARGRARAVLCARAHAIARTAHSHHFTDAARKVLPTLPNGLAWTAVDMPLPRGTAGSCMQAEVPAVGLLSINVTTGTLLVNGRPPNYLPDAVINHGLYKRVFGKRNCAVVTDATGAYRTARPLGGRTYSFLQQGSALQVLEETSDGTVYRLLEHDEAWAAHLPVRLRQLHSHWASCNVHGGQGQEVIVLRPIPFQSRDSQFLVLTDRQAGLQKGESMEVDASPVTRVYRVPSEAAALPVSDLLTGVSAYPRLLTHSCSESVAAVAAVLAKMEPAQYIESYLVPPEEGGGTESVTLRFVLPRCHLEFELCRLSHPPPQGEKQTADLIQAVASMDVEDESCSSPVHKRSRAGTPSPLPPSGGTAIMQEKEQQKERGWALVSREHRGYKLSPTQQLGDTLLGFSEYLVLAHMDEDEAVLTGRVASRVLVPSHWRDSQRKTAYCTVNGAQGTGQRVRLSLPDADCSADLHVHILDVHHRWRSLQASVLSARLQLCALHAATGTRLPEPRTGMTGGERAMELLRQCWVNRPLSSAETAFLRSASCHCDRTPGLALLCVELEHSARALSFLYDPDETAVKATLSLTNRHAASDYAQAHSDGGGNVRTKLSAEEESRALGWTVRHGNVAQQGPQPYTKGAAGWRAPGGIHSIRVLSVAALPFDAFAYVSERENRFKEWALASAAPPRTGTGSHASTAHSEQLEWTAVDSHDKLRSLLGQRMVAELQGSWAAQLGLPREDLGRGRDQLLGLVGQVALPEARSKRQELEEYLRASLQALPAQAMGSAAAGSGSVDCWYTDALRLRRACNDMPLLSPPDIARFVLHPPDILHWNPCLTEDAVCTIQQASLGWLALCVLEDKLTRLLALIKRGSDAGLQVRELACTRVWPAREHPQWLVFEAEQRLQIRPEQYSIIQDILAKPADGLGTIAQLNMGLGKTRVILPCLLLYLTAHSTLACAEKRGALGLQQGQRPLLRLFFLTQLLDEAAEYLHTVLCASVLHKRLFRLPFQRDVELTPLRLQAIRDSMTHCQLAGGALLLAPEHSLSLQLKSQELAIAADPVATSGQLGRISAAASPCLDLFDENDEILSHKRQLIYAVGRQQKLPGDGQRWTAIQSVLHVLRHSAEVAAVLGPCATAAAGASAWQQKEKQEDCIADWDMSAPTHAFHRLQLLPGHALEAALPALLRAIAEGLLDGQGTEHTEWMKELLSTQQCTPAGGGGGVCREDLLDAMTNPQHPISDFVQPCDFVSADAHYQQVLAVRGLLAGGLLAHCLQKRHRVQYGVARGEGGCTRSDGKLLAVPFTGADTPSLRSEFAHPDAALFLTMTSYYGDGLSPREVYQAFATLLKLGTSAQGQIYGRWYQACKASIPADKRAGIDSASKLDLSNGAQMALLHSVYGKCMLCINYWLNSIVLPEQTKIFPQRLLATPWHLTHGSTWKAGFSGTKDASLLLPLAVCQRPSSDASIHATDGRMLQNLLHRAQYRPLDLTHAADASATPAPSAAARRAKTRFSPTVQALLALCASGQHHALIDVGALMAGISNAEVAQQLAARLPRRSHRAVLFYDQRERTWMVRELDPREGLAGRSWPLSSSPIPATDAFVFFHESRCRGSDLKLRPDAVGILTIAPKLCKDALMQAAGRMRGLEFGQTLLIVAPPQFEAMIRESSSGDKESPSTVPTAIDVRAILKYVIVNSVVSATSGLLQWAWHGLHFTSTVLAGTRDARLDDKVALADMYADVSVDQPLVDIVRRMQEAYAGGVQPGAPGHHLLSSILHQCEAIGADVQTKSSSQDTECERELEKEQEEEEEQERELPAVQPRVEYDWDMSTLLRARGLEDVPQGAHALPLHTFTKTYARSFAGLPWDGCAVYGTTNFFLTFADGAQTRAQQDGCTQYLRPLDAAVYIPGPVGRAGQAVLLLLSEREGEKALYACWQSNYAAASSSMFVNVAFLKAAAAAQSTPAPTPIPLSLPARMPTGWSQPPPLMLAGLQLLGGDTSFVSSQVEGAVLGDMLTTHAALASVKEIAGARGRAHEVDKSPLEMLCLRAEQRLHAAQQNSAGPRRARPAAAPPPPTRQPKTKKR